MREKGVTVKRSARSPRQSASVCSVPVPGAGTPLSWARVRGHLRMYRPGQGFASFPPSPAGSRHGTAPRGRNLGRSPSPSSACGGGAGAPNSLSSPPGSACGGAGRGRRGPAELPGSVPPALAYKEGRAVPERRVPRSAPVAPGAAVGEVLGGERVPWDASPRGSPLSELVPFCKPPRAPGSAWAAAGPIRSRCLPVRSGAGRCRGRERLRPALRTPPPCSADLRRPTLCGPPGRALPCI